MSSRSFCANAVSLQKCADNPQSPQQAETLELFKNGPGVQSRSDFGLGSRLERSMRLKLRSSKLGSDQISRAAELNFDVILRPLLPAFQWR
jgi:hypothetical protein